MNEEEQVRVDPVIAYRVWRVMDGNLMAYSSTERWPKFVRAEATCRGSFPLGYLLAPTRGSSFSISKPHLEPAPLSNCGCGFYGFKNIDLVVDHLARPSSNGIVVAGRVALWGDVIDCERGYRAQYAYPQVLYYTPETEAIVRVVAAAYAAEVLPLPDEIRTAVDKAVSTKSTIPEMMLLPGGPSRLWRASQSPTVHYVFAGPVGMGKTAALSSLFEAALRDIDAAGNARRLTFNDSEDKGLAEATLRHPFRTFIASARKKPHHGRHR